jgi:RNA polymerase sigma-70 factor, ECF subfamily
MNEEPSNSPDARLVRLILENRQRLFAYIYSRVPSKADTEDLIQETFLTACAKFDEFEPGTDFFAWVRQIAYYKIKHFQRTFARSRVIFDGRLLENIEETTDALMPELEEYTRSLTTCMEKLKPRDRKMIEQRYAEGGGVDAAARISGRSTVATYKALHRVREALLRCVRHQVNLNPGAA